MKELAATIADAVGYEGEVEWDATKPNGQPRRKLDVSRARDYFGFEAQVPFDEGIRRTVQWWEANRDGYDDLAIGVPGESVGDKGNAGAVNVVYGSSEGLTAESAIAEIRSLRPYSVETAEQEECVIRFARRWQEERP